MFQCQILEHIFPFYFRFLLLLFLFLNNLFLAIDYPNIIYIIYVFFMLCKLSPFSYIVVFILHHFQMPIFYFFFQIVLISSLIQEPVYKISSLQQFPSLLEIQITFMLYFFLEFEILFYQIIFFVVVKSFAILLHLLN